MDDLIQSTAFMPPIASTMQSSCELFLFGDLTVSFEEDLRQLLHVKDNAILRSFFEKVGYAYRSEFAKLPAEQQAWFPRFTTVVDLLSKLGETEGTPALSFSLFCLCEIAQFIRYVSSEKSTLLPRANPSSVFSERGRDRIQVPPTATLSDFAPVHSLLQQSVHLKLFRNWYPLVSRPFSWPSAPVFAL